MKQRKRPSTENVTWGWIPDIFEYENSRMTTGRMNALLEIPRLPGRAEARPVGRRDDEGKVGFEITHTLH